MKLQGGPSGRGTMLVNINLKVLLLTLKRNSYFNVNKRLPLNRCTTLYGIWILNKERVKMSFETLYKFPRNHIIQLEQSSKEGGSVP